MADLYETLSKKPETQTAPDAPDLYERLGASGMVDGTAPHLDELNSELSGMDKFLVGAGRGMTTIGRAVGLADPEDEYTKRAFNELSDDSMAATVGEVVGEAAPFTLAGPISGLGLTTGAGKVLIPAAEKLLARAAMTGILGATEGAAIVKGKGGDTAEIAQGAGLGGSIAGALEVLLPHIGRLGSKVFRQLGKTPKGPLITPEGPSPQLIAALNEANMTFDDLTDEAIEFVVDNQKKIVDPAEVARKSRFDELEIPYTKGDISQDFAQQAEESRLLSTLREQSEPLRQFKLEQSDAAISKVRGLADELGSADDAGSSIKAALSGRKQSLTDRKNALYRQAAEQAPELNRIPIQTESILGALPDRATLKRLGRIEGGQIKALRELLVEFGIDSSDEAVEAFGDEITPLSMGNFEDFRQALNQIERADKTGAATVAVAPIKRALDAEAELMEVAFKEAGIEDQSVLGILKEARSTVREKAVEFSPKELAGKLIDTQKSSDTPVIEASQAVKKLIAKATPVEQVDNVIQSLSKGGDNGRKAIGDIRASVILKALDDALAAPSRKTSGVATVGGNQFHKSLKGIGDDKLNVIFKGDKKTLEKLKNMERVLLDMTPSADAMPKGSAPVIIDMLHKVSRIPVISETWQLASMVTKAGGDDRAVGKALNAKPDLRHTAGLIEAEFPALAAAIGLSAANEYDEESN